MEHDPLPNIEASIGDITPDWRQHAYTLWSRSKKRLNLWRYERYGSRKQCEEMAKLLDGETLILPPGEAPVGLE